MDKQKIVILDFVSACVSIHDLTKEQEAMQSGELEEVFSIGNDCEYMNGDILIQDFSEKPESEPRGSLTSIKVEAMTSNSTGKAVSNQLIIYTNEGRYFQSYDSIIAFIPKREGKTVLDSKYWDYSTTTGKYRNKFLSEGIDETRKKIKSGLYTLADLNQ